ncbi:hypothetical protein ACROYT_G002953 [Oculina patagonica]
MELVSRDKWALACRDYTGRTPLHEAVRKNNKEMVKLLLMEDQTKIHSGCDHWQDVQGQDEAKKYFPLSQEESDWQDVQGGQHITRASLTLSLEESVEYHQDICHCGYTPLHLAARYGYWKMAIDLVKSKAWVGARDCFGATPLHVAACHNHWVMVYLLSELGSDINGKTFNGSTPLHSAAACGAVEVIDELLYYGSNLSAVDDSGLTALHYAVLNITSSQLNRKIIFNATSSDQQIQLVTIDRTGHLAEFFTKENHVKNTDHYRWLDTLIHLIRRGSSIDAVDTHSRTTLHIAAGNGLADAVNVLLQQEANLEISDKFGKTPLEVAVVNGTIVPEHRRKESTFFLGTSLDGLRGALSDHEMVVYLLLTYGASFKKWGQPYLCKDNLGRTPLVAYLHNGGYLLDVVLQHFNASVTIKCGKPFNLSVFHLLCYRPPSLEALNFFQQRKYDNQKCLSLESSIITAIENHRLKHKVIDSCLDAEGFTPLHRAAQGANIVAIRSLIKHGADISLPSPQGHDALTLAILHAGGNIWQTLEESDVKLSKDNASDVAIELLRLKMKTRGFQIVCDSSKPELTLYHLAASRGLVKFIKQIFKDNNLHKLDVDCPNRDGITPMYLAKVFSFHIDSDIHNPWEEVVQFIESQGGQMQYPSRGAEFNAVYNRFYGWIPKDFKLNLRPDVRVFFLGLLSSYGYWQNSSMHCQLSSMNKTSMEVGSPASTANLYTELLRQLELLNRKRCLSITTMVSVALNDLKVCLKKQKIGSFFFTTYSRSE